MDPGSDSKPTPTASPAPRRRFWRRWLKRVGWGLVGLVLLLVAFLIALRLAFPDDEIRKRLEQLLREQTGLEVQAGGLSWNPLSGLALVQVNLLPPAGFSRPPLQIERVEVGYVLTDFLGEQPVIRQVRLIRPRLEWEQDAAGRSNVGQLLQRVRETRAARRDENAEPAAPGGFSLALESVEVRDGQLTIGHRAVELQLVDFQLDLQGELGGQGSPRLQAELQAPAEGRLSVPALGASWPLGLSLRAGLDRQGRLEAGGGFSLVLEPSDGARLSGAFHLVLDGSDGPLTVDELELALDSEPLLSANASLTRSDGGWALALAIPQARLPLERLAGLAPGWSRRFEPRGRVQLVDLRSRGSLAGWPEVSGRVRFEDLGLRLDAGLALAGARGTVEGSVVPAPEGSAAIALRGELHPGDLPFPGGTRGLDLRWEATASAAAEEGGWLLERPVVSLDLRAPAWNGPLTLSAPTLELRAVAERVRLLPGREARLERPRWNAVGRATQLTGPGALRLVQPVLESEGEWQELEWRPGAPVAGRLAGRVRASARRLTAGGLEAADLQAMAQVQAGRLAGGQFSPPLELRLEASAQQLAVGPGRLAGIQLHGRLRGAQPWVPRWPIELSLGLRDLEVGLPAPHDPLVLSGESALEIEGRLLAGEHRLEWDRGSVALQDWLRLDGSGWLDWRARQTSLAFQAQPHRVERIREGLPADLRRHVPPVVGEVDWQGKLEGSLRVPRNLSELALRAELLVRHRGLALAGDRGPVQFSGLSGQVSLDLAPRPVPLQSRLTASCAELSLAAARLRAVGAHLDMQAGTDGSRWTLEGRTGLVALQAGESEAVSLLRDAGLDFSWQLVGWKDLRLERWRLQLPAAGFEASGSGQLVAPAGDRPWLEFGLTLDTTVRFQAAEPLAWRPGLAASGAAELHLALQTTEPGVLAADGRLAFDGFNLVGSAFGLRNARGSLPLRQRLALAPQAHLLSSADSNRPATGSGHSAAYEEALRPLGGQTRSFYIQEVRWQDLRLRDLSANLEWRDGLVSLGGLRFSFLGGDVLADSSVVLTPAEARRLTLEAEMSGVDLSALRGGGTTDGGSSDISGNLRLGLDWAQRDLHLTMDLTQIGQATLRALLVTVDPTEVNPSVLQLRRYLDRFQVAPRQVSLQLRHGLLGMRSEFDMGLAARAAAGFIEGFQGETFVLSQVPVGGLLSKYLDF